MLCLLSSKTGCSLASYASRCIRQSLSRLKYLMPRIMLSCHAVYSLCSAARARCGLWEAPAGRVPAPVSVFFHLCTELSRFEAALSTIRPRLSIYAQSPDRCCNFLWLPNAAAIRVLAISYLPTYAQSLPAVPASGSSNGFLLPVFRCMLNGIFHFCFLAYLFFPGFSCLILQQRFYPVGIVAVDI